MATSANVNDAFSLMLVIVVLALHRYEVQAEVNPGLQCRVSQKGFDYASRVAVDLLYERTQKIEIPDSGDYVSNIHVTSVIKPSSSLVANQGSITWSLLNTGISLIGDWRYDIKKWFIRIRDSGTFTGSVSGASISVSVRLGLDAFGHPTISSTDCSCSISSISIKLSGGASWLYNLIISFFDNRIRNVLQTKVCEAATNVLNGKANDLLKSFPLQMAVDKVWWFDYSFLSAPELQTGYLDTKHKAKFFYIDDPTDPPIQAEPFPTTTTAEKMVTIWVSDYVLNTVGYAMHKHNLLSYTLTPRDLPDDSKLYLSTTCSPGDICVGNMFTNLSSDYPTNFVEVKIAVTKAPTTSISTSHIEVTFTGVITCSIRASDDSAVELLRINVVLIAFIEVKLNATVLQGYVTNIIPSIEVISSSVGSISNDTLLQAFESLCHMLLIPTLNEMGQKGFPIPLLSGINFTNLDLKMQNRCLRITTDVERSL